MLYVFEKIDELPDDFPELCGSCLSLQRREKAFSYRFPLDRKLSVAAYLLLCLNLRENYGICEPVVFSYGKNGKPCLRDYPEIHFSLSHCRSAAACAVSRSEVGVDVQDIAPVSDALASRVLTPKEYAEFKSAENPARRFCEYWVAKESFLKKSGDGISEAMISLSADSIGEKAFFADSGEYIGCASPDCGPARRVETAVLMLYTNLQ